MKKYTTCFCIGAVALLLSSSIQAGEKDFEWAKYPVPVILEDDTVWELQKDISDDFNYDFQASKAHTTFGGKWTNFYHNEWEGPGPTKWVHENVSVSGGNLRIKATRVEGENKTYPIFNHLEDTKPATRAGCITSTDTVVYPVFVETRVKIANAVMASDVWLLSPDDTQEIDIIEAYGGAGEDQRNPFSKNIHLSHHVFIREPFTDYQPGDHGSWYEQNGVESWGLHPDFVRIGVYWKSPTHLEYYIDGKLVRILSDNAFATLDTDGSWQYSYPTGIKNGRIKKATDGYQAVRTAASLEAAQTASTTSVIDPMGYTAGSGLSKPMEIIINMEDQNWNAYQGRTPTNSEIKNEENHTFKVDWVRVYKPVSK